MKNNKISIEFLLIIPVFLFMAVFYIYPLVNMLSISFWDDGFTFQQYINVFKTDLYYNVFLRSVTLAGLVTFFSFLIGYPLAYYITYSKHKLLLFGVVMISMWLGIIIRSYGWMGILGESGILNYFLGLLGFSTKTMLYNKGAVIIGMVHILMPFMVLPIFSVMSNIPKNVLGASKSLGATNLYTFIKVYFPLSLPGILAGALLVFIQSIGFYITPALLGGSKEVMIAQLIEVQVNDLLNWPFAGALATTLLLITTLTLYLCSKFVPLNLLWGGK
jgi:ABC-type spermidine/putrescine transport system permease subunit I